MKSFILDETPASERLTSRAAIERQIDWLISLLDAFDGDPDIEADEDFEPSLAGACSSRFGCDLELDDSDREPSEPSLAHHNGSHLSGGGSGI